MILSMDKIPEIPYLSAQGLSRPIPLERFLPDCQVGVVKQYLSNSIDSNAWILDPFGSNPLLDIEAAACGHRILVASNNPILAFALRMLAAPRKKNDYLSALAEIASQARGSERLETHLRALYSTRCAICHNVIQASGYIWQRGQKTPHARIYTCSFCGDDGERPVTEEDLAILEPLQRGEKLPYARAIGKVLHGNQDERPAVEEALKLYNARSLYVLFTLLNKLEGMNLSQDKQELLEALMVSGLEAGASLWPWPNAADPPRQLTLPAVYLEKNIWLEMEKSIDLWSQPDKKVDLRIWPDAPPASGISLFKGPIRSLELPAEIKIGQILALPPRPNQALWTLSALWSAWLWGRDTETTFSQVLGRRRFDWHWHTNALHQALTSASELAGNQVQMFLMIGEPSPGMTLATCAAANCTGFEMQGIAYKSPSDPLQLKWKMKMEKKETSPANVQAIARTAIQELLTRLGEPADYLTLFSAIVASLTVNDGLPGRMDQFTQEKSSELQGIIARLFSDREFLRRFDETSQELDSGKWGLVNQPVDQLSLADRLESETVKLLQKGMPVSLEEIKHELGRILPGFMTPPDALLEYILKSYADGGDTGQTWMIKQQELGRETDVNQVKTLLNSLAKRLGWSCTGKEPLVWENPGLPSYCFFVSTSACLGQFCHADQSDAQKVVVLPGSRAELSKYKLLRDPQLREAVEGWHFLKFRTLRNVAEKVDLTPESWQMMLDSDPVSLEETTQLRMFG